MTKQGFAKGVGRKKSTPPEKASTDDLPNAGDMFEVVEAGTVVGTVILTTENKWIARATDQTEIGRYHSRPEAEEAVRARAKAEADDQAEADAEGEGEGAEEEADATPAAKPQRHAKTWMKGLDADTVTALKDAAKETKERLKDIRRSTSLKLQQGWIWEGLKKTDNRLNTGGRGSRWTQYLAQEYNVDYRTGYNWGKRPSPSAISAVRTKSMKLFQTFPRPRSGFYRARSTHPSYKRGSSQN
jgi:hypothetical protein